MVRVETTVGWIFVIKTDTTVTYIGIHAQCTSVGCNKIQIPVIKNSSLKSIENMEIFNEIETPFDSINTDYIV